jgi:competence protein ComGC
MKKSLVTAGIAVAVATTGIAGLGVATAATQNNSANSPMSSLVDAISTKFKLNKADVQAVFDEQHTKMETQRTAKLKTELDQLVKDGKLTQKQADAITAKRAEIQKEREVNRTTMQTKTDEERKSTMETKRTELDKWFSDNNIPTEYRYLVMGGGHGHGGPGRGHGNRGGGMMGGNGNAPTSSNTRSTN